MEDNKGSQENHTLEMAKVSNMFIQVLDDVKRKQNSLKKEVHENVLEQIFDLLIKLEQKQNGQGLKFVSDVVSNFQTKTKSSSDLSKS